MKKAKTNLEMIPVSCRLDPEIKKMIDSRCWVEGITKSELIRAIIINFINKAK